MNWTSISNRSSVMRSIRCSSDFNQVKWICSSTETSTGSSKARRHSRGLRLVGTPNFEYWRAIGVNPRPTTLFPNCILSSTNVSIPSMISSSPTCLKSGDNSLKSRCNCCIVGVSSMSFMEFSWFAGAKVSERFSGSIIVMTARRSSESNRNLNGGGSSPSDRPVWLCLFSISASLSALRRAKGRPLSDPMANSSSLILLSQRRLAAFIFSRGSSTVGRGREMGAGAAAAEMLGEQLLFRVPEELSTTSVARPEDRGRVDPAFSEGWGRTAMVKEAAWGVRSTCRFASP
mmetsp:Transcript_41845/g.53923  ORF Transcript_41845/g.53923 Transcript_41845/m.53923 type:complete len:289 (-) Transcript_41845:41-907(-)